MKTWLRALTAVLLSALLCTGCGGGAAVPRQPQTAAPGQTAESRQTAQTSASASAPAAASGAPASADLADTYWVMEDQNGAVRFCDLVLRAGGTGRFRLAEKGRFAVDGWCRLEDCQWTVSGGTLRVGRQPDGQPLCTAEVSEDGLRLQYEDQPTLTLARTDLPEEGPEAIVPELTGTWALSSVVTQDNEQSAAQAGVSSTLDCYGMMNMDLVWNGPGERIDDPNLQVEVDEGTPLFDGCPNEGWSAELTGTACANEYALTLIGDELWLMKITCLSGDNDGEPDYVYGVYRRSGAYGMN